MADLRSLPDTLHRWRAHLGRGKKRLTALADWEFGGGGEYCAACPSVCPDCPRGLHAPRTVEGWQVWDLVQRLGGQLRMAGGMSGGIVIGWDMAAALQLGAALGISPFIIAELLPPIEAVMVRKVNQATGAADI